MKAYLINLDRAQDRLKTVGDNLKAAGFEVERVEAIDGKKLQQPYENFSVRKYRYYHGKKPIAAELGCYFSHLKALEAFLASDDKFGLILEDDIFINKNALEHLQAACERAELWDILRLTGLHSGTPLTVCHIQDNLKLSINLTRQTGAGAYLVNRRAAEVLLKKLLPMRLPYDHAFDREWFMGLKAMSLLPYPFRQNTGAFESQIANTSNYKYPAWQRYWTVMPYRTFNEVCRVFSRLTHYLLAKL